MNDELINFVPEPVKAAITFTVDNGATEILRFEANGDIFVKGRMVENDKEVIEALRTFLTHVGALRPNDDKK